MTRATEAGSTGIRSPRPEGRASLRVALTVLVVVSYVKGRPLLAGGLAGLLVLVAVGAGLGLRAWLCGGAGLNGLALVAVRAVSRLVLCLVFYGVLAPVGCWRVSSGDGRWTPPGRTAGPATGGRRGGCDHRQPLSEAALGGSRARLAQGVLGSS